MAGDFPEDIRQFLVEKFSSVDELELLLLLRADPGKAWHSAALGRALATPPKVAAVRLNTLHTIGLLSVTPGAEPSYRYEPRSAELDAMATRLEKTYRERRSAVISIIYSKPLSQVQAFADAFRLRKKE